jgi:hypothetical protein
MPVPGTGVSALLPSVFAFSSRRHRSFAAPASEAQRGDPLRVPWTAPPMEVWANEDKDNASTATVIATASIFATANIY